jgi:hypothetical protein
MGGKMSNGGSGKLKAGVLGALLPIALAKLLEDKGIITEEELNKAMAKTVLEVAIKQKAIKKRVKNKEGRKNEK